MEEVEFKKDGARIVAFPEFAKQLEKITFDPAKMEQQTEQFLKQPHIPHSLREYLEKHARSTFTSSGINRRYTEHRRMYALVAPRNIVFLVREAGASPAAQQHELLKRLHQAGVHAIKPIGYVTIKGNREFVISRLLPHYITIGDYLEWLEKQPMKPETKAKRRIHLAEITGNALAQAHGVGILHRDMHPWNLLVKRNRWGFPIDCRVIDLEMSRLVEKPTAPQRRKDLDKLVRKTTQEYGALSREEKIAFLHGYNPRLARKIEAIGRK